MTSKIAFTIEDHHLEDVIRLIRPYVSTFTVRIGDDGDGGGTAGHSEPVKKAAPVRKPRDENPDKTPGSHTRALNYGHKTMSDHLLAVFSSKTVAFPKLKEWAASQNYSPTSVSWAVTKLVNRGLASREYSGGPVTFAKSDDKPVAEDVPERTPPTPDPVKAEQERIAGPERRVLRSFREIGETADA